MNLLRLREALRDRGWIEGRNLVVEERFADGHGERLADLAADLARLPVDVIVTQGSPATRAAKQATITIPIVMWNTTDPVGQGFVSTLARPGGNVTGVADFAGELTGKRLELLRDLLPNVRRVALFLDPGHSAHVVEARAADAAATRLGLTLIRVEVRERSEVTQGLARALSLRAEALLVFEGFVFADSGDDIIPFAARHRLPMISGVRTWTERGALLSYAPDIAAMWRSTAAYVDRILRGARPSDLPVEQPTRLELTMNLRTAKALGLTIPPSILVRADHIIE
jgi:ABC-type uncharacterized transport system substrate-binding protein